MSAIGRVGDMGTGICYCHKHPKYYTTTIISGAEDVVINGLPVAQIGSIGVATCGHTTIALTGGSVLIDGKFAHRVGDMGQGCSGSYTLITGSDNTING
jgi:uncharacterized Zn-binding protein involved in type VI secretion